MRHLIPLLILTFVSCKTEPTEFPYLGKHQVAADGTETKHKIRPFTYHNQDSIKVTNESFAGQPYIADFFFTSCPSICPKVTKQMLRLYEHLDGRNVPLVSFTIDPKRDDVAKLNLYARNLEVSSDRWHFLTGDKDFTLDLADDYFVAAYEDPDAPGGFDHSGKIILVDGDGHVRAFAEGTDPEDVSDFIKDVDRFINDIQP